MTEKAEHTRSTCEHFKVTFNAAMRPSARSVLKEEPRPKIGYRVQEQNISQPAIHLHHTPQACGQVNRHLIPGVTPTPITLRGTGQIHAVLGVES